MNILESISLASYTSFFIGGPAKYFCEVQTPTELTEALVFASSNNLKTFLLGGGSNILVSDKGFDGLVIHLTQQGINIVVENDNSVIVEVAAGQQWDSVVEFAVKNNFWGIENLSHIPGSSGAFAVQNVGAYGQEASQTVEVVTAYDTQTAKVVRLMNAQCNFRYRASIFNREEAGRYVILSMQLKLQKHGQPNLTYGDMEKYFSEKPVNEISLTNLREAIIEIRNRKYPFPVNAQTGSAGSFFRGPVISHEEWPDFESSLAKHFGTRIISDLAVMKNRLEVPQGFKTPTAFLIDICGYKGTRVGGAVINPQQPAVILNTGTASANDVLELFKIVRQGVVDKSGVILEHEPEFIGFEDEQSLV